MCALYPSQQDFMDFGFHDFVNDSNFDQFVELLRGENEDQTLETCYPVNCDNEMIMFNNEWAGNYNSFATITGDMFDFNNGMTAGPNSNIDSLKPCCEEIGVEDIDQNDEDYSSGTTATPGKATTNHERSKTLVSERRRRGRMKERLYALRSLVPNITKMDKASIIGDAVLYVQQLQMQAKTLKAEITGLEASLKGGAGRFQGRGENLKKPQVPGNKYPICRKIEQMEMFQVEEGEFYVRLVCKKGDGVAVLLHKALESLTPFDIQSSNFSTINERSVLTFTLNVRECGEEMNLSSLKLWVTGALLNQGFEFKTL